MDGAATHHITPHKHVFSSLVSTGLPQLIQVAGPTAAVGKGTVRLAVKQPQKQPQIVELREVLWVPTAGCQLFSEIRAQLAGARVSAQGGSRQIRWPGGVCIRAQLGVSSNPIHTNLFTFSADSISTPAHPIALASTVQQTTAQLWHRRLGHLSPTSMAQLPAMVKGLNISSQQAAALGEGWCAECLSSKQSRQQHTGTSQPARQLLELLHTDVMGPLPESLGGSRYVVTVLDDWSAACVARPVREKSAASKIVQEVVQRWENSTGHRVKVVRSDRGGEYVNHEQQQWCISKGIQQQLTPAYTPQLNGKAERLNRTLIERVRAMLHGAQLSAGFWAEAVQVAAHIINRSPSSSKQSTPFQLFYGHQPSIAHLRVFGAPTSVLIQAQQRSSKLSPVSEQGVMVGYSENGHGYRVWVPSKHKVVISGDVRFDERPAQQQPAQQSTEQVQQLQATIEQLDQSSTAADSEHQGDQHAAQGGEDAALPAQQAEPQQQVQPAAQADQQQAQPPQQQQQAEEQHLRRSTRQRGPPSEWWRAHIAVAYSCGVTNVAIGQPPQSLAQAMQQPDSSSWTQACDEEMAALQQNSTWQLLPLPAGVRPLDLKWVLTTKPAADSSTPRYKARLVVKGCAQRPGEYGQLYAPVAMTPTLRTLLAKVAAEDLELHQLDICTAFLNGELGEEVWVVQPEGYQKGGPGLAYKLQRALYGLKQAPRAWHEKLQQVMVGELGYTAATADPSLFVKHSSSGSIWVLVYVDDMLVAAKQLGQVQKSMQEIMGRFRARDLGEAGCYLGMEISRNRAARTLNITQQRYTEGVLQKFSMPLCRGRRTPLAPGTQLSQQQGQQMGSSRYAELVGCLQYAAQHTRPDLAHSVALLSRFMAAPTDQHWTAAQGVLRYFGGSKSAGILYGGEPSSRSSYSSQVVGFGDASLGGCPDTGRSTEGYVFMVFGGAVGWKSKRQQCVTRSTAASEYLAAATLVAEALWFKKLQQDLQLGKSSDSSSSTGSVQLYTDNTAALSILHNPMQTKGTKHIDLAYHFARERTQQQEVTFNYVSTDRNVADIMTKSLQPERFHGLLRMIGCVCIA